MGFLADKRILITGLLSKHSIAYGIAKACHREGAKLAFHLPERTLPGSRRENSPPNSAATWFSSATSPKTPDRQAVRRTRQALGRPRRPGPFDRLRPEAKPSKATFLDGITRESFRIAHDVSSYSYPALVKAARPMMQGRKSAALALSYLGAERTMPNYNTMGLAKASLEAATRYLAFCLGPQGIRANAISAGPIKTLAASGIGNFGKLLDSFAKTRRCAATSPSTKWATPPLSCSPIWRVPLPAKSCMSMAA